MEFGLSESQESLQNAILKCLKKASSLQRMRFAVSGDQAVMDDIRSSVGSLGVSGILVPEALGGLGLTVLDAALMQEAMGRHMAPTDTLGNTMAIAGILASGTPGQKARLLDGVISGEVRFGAAVSEWIASREGAGVRVTKNGRLSGKALFVLEIDSATHFLVVDQGGGLSVIDRNAGGLVLRRLITIDATRSIGEIVLEDVDAERLSAESSKGRGVDRMLLVGRTLLAADTLGAAQEMIEKAVAYSLERKQFGRAIGSFQAVKHLCAEMAAELEPCRSLVWYAAHAVDEFPAEAALMVCHAKAHLSEVGQFVARSSIEVHGGMGFTDELGLHHWFKRIGVNRQLLGGPEQLRKEAGRLQGWADA